MLGISTEPFVLVNLFFFFSSPFFVADLPLLVTDAFAVTAFDFGAVRVGRRA